jgi:cytoskeletal protein CcmA (bactofilin family)
MSKPYNNGPDKVSVLGPTLVFKGELIAEEDLVLKGRVEGSIKHTASLKISQEGSVKGNIKAVSITVEGAVDGDLFGSESVTVQESAKVTGNIYSRKVSLIEGARFKGSIDMGNVDASYETSGSEDADAPSAHKAAAARGK